MENLKEYQEACKRTASKGYEDKEKELMFWGLGVAGEAGDLAGCIKKLVGHKNDQRDGIRENVGDTMWYLATICNYFDWDMTEILNENIEKLKKRYSDGFTYEDAKRGNTRTDWMEK